MIRGGRVALLFVVSAVLLIPALIACDGSTSPPETPEPGKVLVRIGDLTVEAEVPQTAEEFSRGLGGRASMDEDQGMLFVFASEAAHAFWMKDMLFSLDFVWISSDLRVVEVISNVEPQPGVPDNELAIYRPPEPALYTLELVAGVAEKRGVEPGDVVELVLPEDLQGNGANQP